MQTKSFHKFCNYCSSSIIKLFCILFYLTSSQIKCNVIDQTIENFTTSNLVISNYYTFTRPSSLIKLTANQNITNKLIHSKKEIHFDFRTRYPNTILFYESFRLRKTSAKDGSMRNDIFELFLAIKNGRFRVLIDCWSDADNRTQELIIGYGFSDDNVHHVRMYMNVELGFFNIRLNSTHQAKHYHSLYFNSSILKQNDQQSIYEMMLGSHTSMTAIGNSPFHSPFIGCIGNINFILRATGNNFDTLSSSKLELGNVDEGCIDQCHTNLCSRKSRCINFYDTKKCNCFGTGLEDWHCRSFNYTVITLRGYSSISYKIYSFEDKYYSDENLISFHVKSKTNDGLLFAAMSEMSKNYLIINLKNGFLNILFDLGNNPKNYIFNHYKLTDGQWHNITIHHRYNALQIVFDTILQQVLKLDNVIPYFFFDPEIFIGGFPSNLDIRQLKLPFHLANKKYIGCLKHVYFNRYNILYDLNRHNKRAKYHSPLPFELGCNGTFQSVAMTFHAGSFFRTSLNQTKTFSLRFKIKPETSSSNIDSIQISNGTFVTKTQEQKKWSLSIVNNIHIKLTIKDVHQPDGGHGIHWTLSNDNSVNTTQWNVIGIFFKNDAFVEMIVNEFVVKGRYDSVVDHFYGDLSFGSIDRTLIACLKDIFIDENELDGRILIDQVSIIGKITLDNCQLVNPCNRADACEHDAICIPSIENGTYSCDCSNTGYIGKTCYFSLYRKSCEEIYLMDKQSTGIYLLDIDRNGPTPPAHVICEMGGENSNNYDHDHDGPSSNGHLINDTIRTVIEHNIQHQVIIRERGRQGNFYMDIHYRDFTRDMLRLLVHRSNTCQQYLRYECNNAPLSLSTYTLLYSIRPEHKLVRIDSGRPRGCLCNSHGQHNAVKCSDPNKHCNCDDTGLVTGSGGWKHDEGYLFDKNDVGITKMVFLQYPNMSHDSEAHLFLGNLSCVDFNTQKYEITFKTKESYLEVDGWLGDGQEMAISFKTTANNAVVFYQSHLDTTTTYFKAVIISENEIRFEYCYRGRKSIVTVASSRCLNCGQWQQVLVERNQNQMRLSINQNFKILYLEENEYFVDFDGKLYVGGAPLKYLQDLEIKLGFIGCLRGLVLDGKVIDLHQYLNAVRYPNIESGCRPYCKANLCQNQAICLELWGSYQCKCANPIAHYGRNCEININRHALTLKGSTYLKKTFENIDEIQSILREDLILSFRTHLAQALLLYAHDKCNNFLQLHIANGTNVVLSFNVQQKVVQQRMQIGNMLANGHPVQVKIGRSVNNTLFIVNKNSIIIPYSTKWLMHQTDQQTNCSSFVFDYSNSNEQFIVRFDHNDNSTSSKRKNELYIGGIDSEENNSLIHQLSGFVGCIQGIKTGTNLIFDIDKNVDLESTFEMGNKSLVKAGCRMLCDDMPCNNGGICTEDWLNESTNCDCESTSYRGQSCNVDIGAHFQKDQSSVVYLLYHKIMDFNYVDITLAFSSSYQNSTTLLMIRYANSSRYLHIALHSNGKLLFEEDNGHEFYSDTIENEEEETFFDSYRHWIRYTRRNNSVQVIVDSIIYVIRDKYKQFSRAMADSNINVIIVGSNRAENDQQINHNFNGFYNFRGCISNINIQLDDLKIDPFESAFGIRSGLNDVKVNGQIKQGICASFKIHQQHQQTGPKMRIDQTLILLNRKEIWFNRPKPHLLPYRGPIIDSMSNFDNGHTNSGWSKSKIVITISITYLTIVLASIAFYLWKIEKRYRLLKFQGETPFFHKSQQQRTNHLEKNYVKFNFYNNHDDDNEVDDIDEDH